MKLLLVAGARPNFMKLASLVDALRTARLEHDGSLDFRLVHTGQHYDDKMSSIFFSQLDLPTPDHNLEVGSASHAEQTAEIMKRFEPIVYDYQPDVVVVVGDVNSTIACALVTSKVSFDTNAGRSTRTRPLIAHIEAGLRSFDRSMPEEINRVLTDTISDFHFVTEASAIRNLKAEGHSEKSIFFVGNTMVDTLLKNREKASSSEVLTRLMLRPTEASPARPYALLTLHRPSNVDHSDTLRELLEAILEGARDVPVVFPLHPRTANRIGEFGLQPYLAPLSRSSISAGRRILTVEALPYLDFLCLMDNAALVLTDSGGVQEETTVLEVPCVTLRDTTERPVTVDEGTNLLAGTEGENVVRAILTCLHRPRRGRRPELWDGLAGRRIVHTLKGELERRAVKSERVPDGPAAVGESVSRTLPDREVGSRPLEPERRPG